MIPVIKGITVIALFNDLVIVNSINEIHCLKVQ